MLLMLCLQTDHHPPYPINPACQCMQLSCIYQHLTFVCAAPADRPPTALPRRQRQLLLKQLQARERALMAAGRTPGPVPLLVLCYDSEVKGDEGLEALCQPLPLLDSHQGTASAASVHQNTIRDSGNGSDVSDRARDGTEPASSTLTLGVLQQAVHRYDSALQASTGQRSASPGPVQQSRSQGRPSGPGAASATLFRDLAAQRLVSQSQGSQEFNGWSDSDDDDQEEYPSAVWTWAPVQGLVPVYASTTTATGQGGASLLGNQKPWGSDHKQQQQQQQQRVLAFLTPAAAQAIRRSVQDDPSPPAAQGSTSASPSSTGGPTSSTQAPPGAQPQPRLCVLSLDMGQAGGISVYHPDPRLRELMYQALVVQSVKHLLQVRGSTGKLRHQLGILGCNDMNATCSPAHNMPPAADRGVRWPRIRGHQRSLRASCMAG
jgi:hypothetical protein